MEDPDYAINYPLHDLIRLYTDQGRFDNVHWWNKFQDLLKVPGAYCQPDPWGNSPLSMFNNAAGNASFEYAPHAVRALVVAGANPLEGIGDNHARPPSCLGEALYSCLDNGPYQAMGYGMIAGLIDRYHQGNPLRGPGGKNALHVLAYQVPSSLFDVLNMFASSAPQDIPASWVNEKDENGRTPCHAFFCPGSSLYKTVMTNRKDQDDLDENLWEAILNLIDRGADLSLKDDKGKSAASYIADCVQMGFRVEEGAGGKVWSHMQAFVLNEETSRPGGLRKSPRL